MKVKLLYFADLKRIVYKNDDKLLLLLVCMQYTCNRCQKGLNTIRYICWLKNKTDEIWLQYNYIKSKVITVYYCVWCCVLLPEETLYLCIVRDVAEIFSQVQTLGRGWVRAMNTYSVLLNNWLRIQTLASYTAHTIHYLYSVIATIQPRTQNKTKQLGWCGIIIGKKTTTPHHPTPHYHTGSHYISGSFRQPRKLIFSVQPYSNPTRRNN